MFTELKLTNFRIFDDEVTVRFRPITVLIGRNSSGKSSIIKFLLMLQQSMGQGMSQFLTPEGERVNLGQFSELKNSLTRKSNLTFDLTIYGSSSQSQNLTLYLPDDVDLNQLLYRTNAKVSYSTKGTIGTTGCSISDRKSGTALTDASVDILNDSTFLDLSMKTLFDPEFRSFLGDDPSDTELTFDTVMELFNRHSSLIQRFMAVQQIQDTIRYQLNAARHLSAIRDDSQRVLMASYPPIDDVGPRGQFALHHLQRIVADKSDGYRLILPYLSKVAGIEDVSFDASSQYVTRAFARNHTTGANVLIADYGFGVSQCLPILVQGAIMAPYTTLMVEQPEAQLHPTAQLELGSYFAELWKERKVGSIIETHSDRILLRLRRLIAKGEISHKDVSVSFFTFDQENKSMPLIKNLDINEDGSMEPGLPMEFFGADIMEGLKLGARE